jgi:predicted amidohydrolase
MRIIFLLLIFSGLNKTSLLAQKIAIRNVTIISMEDKKPLTGKTVLISDGLIVGIDNTKPGNSPPGYEVIDGTGKYLTPGLFDMHAHFFNEQGELKNTCETELKLMLANGLTHVRILAGHPNYLQSRRNVLEGKWIGPELSVASPQLVGRWPWPADFNNFEIADTPLKAEQAVEKFKKEGYDAIKITFMVKREVYDAIIKAADKHGMKVIGHVGPMVKLPAALKAGQQIEHMDEFIDMLLPDTSYNHGQSVSDMNIWRKPAWATVPYLDEKKIPELAKAVKASGIYVTPTNYFFLSTFGEIASEAAIRQKPDYAYIPASLKEERWKNRDHFIKLGIPDTSLQRYRKIRLKMVYELWKAGVPLMAGSDSPEFFLVTGFSIHDELATMVKAGLTPFEALKTATVNPAHYLGLDQTNGMIKNGMKADLLLLDADPLKDIGNTRKINAVFKKGVYYNRETLDKLLKEALVLGN